MSESAIIADIQKWFGYIAPVIQALSGKSAAPTAPAAPTTSVSANLGLDILPIGTAAFGTVTAITNLIAARNAELNTPDEVQAADAQNLQKLKDAATEAIAHAEATGDFTAIRLLLS
jgi:hypothetical protein